MATHHTHKQSQFLTTTTIVLLFSFAHLALSEIKTVRIISDARPLILFDQFGYSPTGGRAHLTVSSVSWAQWAHPFLRPDPPPFDPSLLGFFLIPAHLVPRLLNESYYAPRFCPLTSRFTTPLLRFSNLNNSSSDRTVEVHSPDEYSLLFGSCEPEMEVTMDVRTEMYNVGPNGDKEYLSTGSTKLPRMYLGLFLIYFGFLVVWGAVCYRQRWTAEKIHWVMGALLLFKGLKMMCAAEDLWHVESTGSPHGWDVGFYVFGFFKGVLLFTVIVLIGTGWSFLKPYLQEREKDVLKIVIPMQVIENIASVVINETGPAEPDWISWNQIFLIVDVVCCAAVFYPIIWSIRALQEASKTDGKAARNLQKLTLFKRFYVVVVGYLYFTRIVAFAIGALLSYRYRWVATAASEIASLAFYVFVFYDFRPVEKNPYLFIGDEEEAAAAEELEMEGGPFEL